MMKPWTILALLAATTSVAAAQDILPLTDEPESHYYDFWPGVWRQLDGHELARDGTVFRIERGPHRAAFEETWRMRIDDRTVLRARGYRAWDKTNRRWMYTWVSENGLYQVWEGRKVGDRWYIYKEFDIAGDRYLSRQGWFPVGRNELERVSEKSYDGGKTWQLRFRERYRRSRS